jgi:curved DNA-binding protein
VKQTKRQRDRQPVDFSVVMYWEDASGHVSSIRPQARDASEFGLCLDCAMAVPVGAQVYLDMAGYGLPAEAVVRYCVTNAERFRVGVEFSTATRQTMQPATQDVDFYEILQLSPKAEMETIHRVYRIMAGRYHPDNPESGDPEKFLLLSEAYRVLSDPERRIRYDATRAGGTLRPLPLFQAKAFVDDKEGEANRRLGVLCLLYAQRRRDTDHPAICLLDLEQMMSIPREYLEFTLWYLKQKHYVESSQGADFVLTAEGVDYVEEHAPSHSVLTHLLQRPGMNSHRAPQYAHRELAEAGRVQ